jgi:DNA-binding MarR family transcriptional regulator
MPTHTQPSQAPGAEQAAERLPTELRIVLGRLMRRLRGVHRFPLTQAAVLGRLDREGEQSIGALAAHESVRPQSMSQTICELEAEGLVERRADASDARRTQVAITAHGRAALEADRAAREGWLGEAIGRLDEDERRTLQRAVELLERLADGG